MNQSAKEDASRETGSGSTGMNRIIASRAAVLGGGSFGTALAELLARQGTAVSLQMRDKATIEEVNKHRTNRRYLGDEKLSVNVVAVDTVTEAVEKVAIVLLAVPTAFFREFLHSCRDSLPVGIPLVCCSKGIENDSLMTPFEIMEFELPGKYHPYIVVMSGPSFAKEVIQRKLTSVSISARDMGMAKLAQYYISDKYFRAYRSDDVIGCEICGAIKNVYAIIAGAFDSMEVGCDGRAALITRALAEISALAVMKGAHPLTVSGLAGVGDLVLTCTGTLSRNYQVGYRIGKGEKIEDIVKSMEMIAEGVNTAKSLHQMTKRLGINMPIAEEVFNVLYEGKSVYDALETLLSLPLKEELDEFVKNDISKHQHAKKSPPTQSLELDEDCPRRLVRNLP